jgi:uncharacterized membrane protein
MAATRTIGNRLAPPRFILFFILLAGGIAASAAVLPRAQAIMTGFNLAAIVFLIACIPLFRRKASAMRQTARDNDANRVVMLVLTIILSLVILVIVAGELVEADQMPGLEKLMIIATLLLAWAFANMVYALHYAHLFYTSDDGGKDLAGLDFPGNRPEPDYADFVYFSVTIGVALQTSDVMITSPTIRRIVTGQCLAAFVYNLGVLALAINILAG